MNIFELFGTIAIDNAKANKAISDTGNKASGLSNTMEAAFGKIGSLAKKVGTAVVAAFAVDKIKDFGKDCAETYASIAAEQASFEQIMGDYAYMAQEKMDKVASETGMVSSRLTPYMTSMTAKFKGLGYGVDEATNLAQEGLTIAADASAFWDKSLDESMSHLNSFINGSYEGGEAIGLFANDTQMAAYAVKKGIVSETKAWSALDEATKQATRLQYAKDMMAQSGATGQAAKESGEYANVLANLNEHMRQLKGIIGKPILEKLILPAMRTLNKIMPGLTKKTEAFMQGFSDGIDKISGYFKGGLNFSSISNRFENMLRSAQQKTQRTMQQIGQTISNVWAGKVWPTLQRYAKAKFNIDLPDWNELLNTIKTKWETEVLPHITGLFSGEFKLSDIKWETILGTIQTGWIEKVKPKIQNFFDGNFNLSDIKWETILTTIQTGWNEQVKPKILNFFNGKFDIEKINWGAILGKILFGWKFNVVKFLADTFIEKFDIKLPDWQQLASNIKEKWDTVVVPTVTGFLSGLGGTITDALGTPADSVSYFVTGIMDFIQWCGDHKDEIGEAFAGFAGEAGEGLKTAASLLNLAIEAVSGLVMLGTDAVTSALEWILTHGKETAIAIEAIATGLVVAAIAANPFVSAIVAAVAALGLLEAKSRKALSGEVFDKYSDEDLAKLQKYVDALKAKNAAEKEMQDSMYDTDATMKYFDAQEALDQAEAQIEGIDGLKDAYYSYIQANGIGKGDDIYLDVPLRVDEDSESNIQTEIDGMSFDSIVKMVADTSGLQAAVDAVGLSVTVPVYGTTGTQAADGSHANGLDFVPRDGYLARLHYGETVLNRANADAWRSGTIGSAEVGRLETAINALSVLMQQMVANTRGGQQIVLDSGVLVGQLAPRMDEQLGTISGRKGRRN